MLQLHRPKQPKPNTIVNFKLDNSKNVYLSNPISTAPDWKAGCGSFGRAWAGSSAQTLHCAICSAQRPRDPRHLLSLEEEEGLKALEHICMFLSPVPVEKAGTVCGVLQRFKSWGWGFAQGLLKEGQTFPETFLLCKRLTRAFLKLQAHNLVSTTPTQYIAHL